MKARGAGVSEKHFPSRISLQLTPFMQTNVISISVSKSSENPAREIGIEKTIEASIEPPNPYIGLRAASGESMTMSLRPWKFEQSAYGDSANLNWFLHDSINGREVFSTRPSRFQLLHPKAWFKNRYSSAYRPFTRQGGVIFAGDEYGESVVWKVEKGAMGKCMEWEIKGWIWLTYWPNKHRTLFTQTKRLEFREILQVTLSWAKKSTLRLRLRLAIENEDLKKEKKNEQKGKVDELIIILIYACNFGLNHYCFLFCFFVNFLWDCSF